MRKLVKMVSLFGLSLMIVLLSPVVTSTTVHAGTVLTKEDESISAVKLNVQEKSMVTGSTFNLRVYNLTEDQKVSYKSSDAKVVSVTKQGELTAIESGTATITVTVKDNNSGTSSYLTCDITVGPPAVSITLSQEELSLAVGEKTSLKAILKPKTTGEIEAYYSLDPEIATVSARGKVTAKAVGETVIYAEIANGKFAKCVITVTEVPAEEETTEESSDRESGSETDTANEADKESTTTTDSAKSGDTKK